MPSWQGWGPCWRPSDGRPGRAEADMKFTKLDEALYQYLLDHCTPVDDIVHDLVAETSKLGTVSAMQAS